MSNSMMLLCGRKSPGGVDFSFLGETLSPRLVYANASGHRSYFDKNGVMRYADAGIPRFDCDPLTGALRGLLIEGQCTNLVANANGTAWTAQGSNVTTNQVVSPDGMMNAFKITELTTATNHAVYETQSGSFVSGKSYTFSVYLKAGTAKIVQLRYSTSFSAGLGYVNFDLDNGVITAQYVLTGAMTSVGNGWYRCTVTGTCTATGLFTPAVLIGTNNNPNAGYNPSYVGTGLTFYAFGTQCEEGVACSSYILTNGAQATRAADQLSFAIPVSVSVLRYDFDNGTIADLSVTGGVYMVPTSLARQRIKRISSQ